MRYPKASLVLSVAAVIGLFYLAKRKSAAYTGSGATIAYRP